MQLYIARHGETEFNLEGRIQGSGMDSPLTTKGIVQAKALGKSLAGINFDAVYSSPLKRATDTVEIAFAGRYKPILDKRLVEIGLGAMEGMLWIDAAELYPAASSRLSDPVNYIAPTNGETMYDIINRVSAFMDDISKTSHKNVFVLTHGYTARVFQACATGKSLLAVQLANTYRNCEVAHYQNKNNTWNFTGIKPLEGEA